MPAYPTRVALVTSTQTAALQDMLKVLRRFPWLKLFVYHVPVQGDGCGRASPRRCEHLNRSLRARRASTSSSSSAAAGRWKTCGRSTRKPSPARWRGCAIPVVTGIGHEVDTSIADLVADYHAHTPTEAAQVVTAQLARRRVTRSTPPACGCAGPSAAWCSTRASGSSACERHEVFRRPLDRVIALRQLLDDRQRALAMAAGDRLVTLQRRVDALASALQRTPPQVILSRARVADRARAGGVELHDPASAPCAERVNDLGTRLGTRHPRGAFSLASQRLDSLAQRLRRGMENSCRGERQRLDALERHLSAVSPEQVLKRGYSITTRKKDGQIVRRADDVKAGDRLVTRVAEGQVESVVDDAKQPRLFE